MNVPCAGAALGSLCQRSSSWCLADPGHAGACCRWWFELLPVYPQHKDIQQHEDSVPCSYKSCSCPVCLLFQGSPGPPGPPGPQGAPGPKVSPTSATQVVFPEERHGHQQLSTEQVPPKPTRGRRCWLWGLRLHVVKEVLVTTWAEKAGFHTKAKVLLTCLQPLPDGCCPRNASQSHT